MVVPKHKLSKARSKRRRSMYVHLQRQRLEKQSDLAKCPNCGELKLNYHRCPECHAYKGIVLQTKKVETKRVKVEKDVKKDSKTGVKEEIKMDLKSAVKSRKDEDKEVKAETKQEEVKETKKAQVKKTKDVESKKEEPVEEQKEEKKGFFGMFKNDKGAKGPNIKGKGGWSQKFFRRKSM